MKPIKLEGSYQIFNFNLSHRVLTIRCSFLVGAQYFNSDVKFIGVDRLSITIDLENILIRLATEEEQIDFISKGYFDSQYSNFFKIYIVESTIDGVTQNHYVIATMIQVKENYLAPIPLE